MKLKCLFFALTVFYLGISGQALAEEIGLRYIHANGVVKCGTNLFSKAYAYKDEDGQWRGFDADICRGISTAVFGNDKFFEMIHVNPQEVPQALNNNKIDIMLGNTPYSANMDITQNILPVSVMYFDRQVLLAKKNKENENAKSMMDFKGQSVCATLNSEDMYNLEQYNRRYQLQLKIIRFNNEQRAKEGFLLNRCVLLTGNETWLKALQLERAKDDLLILPETLATRPIYAYVERNNTQLQSIMRWIFNAFALAEEKKLNSGNIEFFGSAADASVRNLLGFDETLWKKFGLKPEWVSTVLKELGNYGEIYERNFGTGSELQIDREESNLISSDGYIIPLPFL